MPNPKLRMLREKAMALPLTPGVYIMRNRAGTVIYIGKAKVLKNRVSQYFGSPTAHSPKVRRMVENVDDFDYIMCDSEFEALVLECNLIKKNAPKYNIKLKDDKGYSYIRVSPPPYAKISAVLQKADDGAEYIGPYVSSWTVRESVDEAVKIFKLPTCNRVFPRDIRKARPCLNYSIHQCCAPCLGHVSEEEYNEAIAQAIAFLRGNRNDILRELTEEMEAEAEALHFEKAAHLRDRIQAIRKIAERQKVVAGRIEEQDVIAMAQNGAEACFEVMRYHGGALEDKENFFIGEPGEAAAARMEFIQQYYSMRERIPPQITVDQLPEDAELLEQWLSQAAGRRVHIFVPQKGDQVKLVQMCVNNAAEQIARRTGAGGHEMSALNELGNLLQLPKTPNYIEAYDISNLNGGENVAGMVVFEDGRPLKSAYRKFKIQTVEGQDDYGSMKEVILRRFAEYETLKKTGEGFGRMPDLILLDGGKGHVATVRPILQHLGYEIPVFGMVKDDRHRTRAIAEDGGEIMIRENRPVFTLVANIQEEVHRFAIGYHRQTRKKNALTSAMEGIPGIGQTRMKALLRRFMTVEAIRNATVEELCTVKEMNRPAAEAVYAAFHAEEIKKSTKNG